jgi:capsid protein
MINEYRREIEMAQSQLCIYQICETVGKWFTNTGVLVGRLEANNYADNYYDYNRRDWAPQRWPHIHPTQDVAATKSELELNLTSLDAEAAKRQKKAGDIQRKNAQAKKRQKDLDKEFGLNEPVGE